MKNTGLVLFLLACACLMAVHIIVQRTYFGLKIRMVWERMVELACMSFFAVIMFGAYLLDPSEVDEEDEEYFSAEKKCPYKPEAGGNGLEFHDIQCVEVNYEKNDT